PRGRAVDFDLAHDLHVRPVCSGHGDDDGNGRSALSRRLHERQFVRPTILLWPGRVDHRWHHRRGPASGTHPLSGCRLGFLGVCAHLHLAGAVPPASPRRIDRRPGLGRIGLILGNIKQMALAGLFGIFLAFGLAGSVSAREPRIVNIYNFIRNSDYRVNNSEEVLFEATRNQIDLLKRFHLPSTYALQYDALMNPRYPKLLKQELGAGDEIAAWWEIPQPLAQKAGLAWRGRHEWDPAANVGFSPGYTPAERRKLVDVYMADFKAIFGSYPRTAGSWFIDEVTLDYMARRYRIVASCNCKDQIGTDGYTLWGGYWNQAY